MTEKTNVLQWLESIIPKDVETVAHGLDELASVAEAKGLDKISVEDYKLTWYPYSSYLMARPFVGSTEVKRLTDAASFEYRGDNVVWIIRTSKDGFTRYWRVSKRKLV